MLTKQEDLNLQNAFSQRWWFPLSVCLRTHSQHAHSHCVTTIQPLKTASVGKMHKDKAFYTCPFHPGYVQTREITKSQFSSAGLS